LVSPVNCEGCLNRRRKEGEKGGKPGRRDSHGGLSARDEDGPKVRGLLPVVVPVLLRALRTEAVLFFSACGLPRRSGQTADLYFDLHPCRDATRTRSRRTRIQTFPLFSFSHFRSYFLCDYSMISLSQQRGRSATRASRKGSSLCHGMNSHWVPELLIHGHFCLTCM
jgi:hypothetical protein